MTDRLLQNHSVVVSREELDQIYRNAVARYIASRREKVDSFVGEHFSLKGSLKLHKHALGWDLAKAPINALGSALTVAKYAGVGAMKLAGRQDAAHRLASKNFFVETQLGQELETLIRRDLLEITWGMAAESDLSPDQNRGLDQDQLMLEICKDPKVEESIALAMAVITQMQNESEFQEELTQTLQAYVGSRSAASDISVSLLSVAAGIALFHKVTPGLTALSASISSSLAHTLAAQSFWAGPWAGSLYYSIVGVTAPKIMMLGVFTGLLVPASIIATFSGIVTDPLQRQVGLHQRRLNKVIDTVEQQLRMDEAQEISFKDHYVARVLDLLDVTQSIISLGR